MVSGVAEPSAVTDGCRWTTGVAENASSSRIGNAITTRKTIRAIFTMEV
jgi:hypothetical protein